MKEILLQCGKWIRQKIKELRCRHRGEENSMSADDLADISWSTKLADISWGDSRVKWVKWIKQKIKELRCRHHQVINSSGHFTFNRECCVTITEKNVILRFCCHCGKRY